MTGQETEEYYRYIVHENGDWEAAEEVRRTIFGKGQQSMPPEVADRIRERMVSGGGTFLVKGDPDDVAQTFKKLSDAGLTGVTVVTTVDETGRRWGFTATSFSSVSLRPPQILVCIARSARAVGTAMDRAPRRRSGRRRGSLEGGRRRLDVVAGGRPVREVQLGEAVLAQFGEQHLAGRQVRGQDRSQAVAALWIR